jgi:hypothetical protein
MSETSLNAGVSKLRIHEKRLGEIPCRISMSRCRGTVLFTGYSFVRNYKAPHFGIVPQIFAPNASARSTPRAQSGRALGNRTDFARSWRSNQIDVNEEAADQWPISATKAYAWHIRHGCRRWVIPLAYFLLKSRRRMDRPDRAFACGLSVRVGPAVSGGSPTGFKTGEIRRRRRGVSLRVAGR